MKILVSNDDGYQAEGIARLRAALAEVADVIVVAPDRNRSGASNSLTLDVPLRVTKLVGRPLDPRLILNINVPDLPLAQLRGIRATRLGFRHRSEPAVPVRNPKGECMYWVGPSGAGADAGEGTDFLAVAEGWVSVTPLSIAVARHSALPE